MALKAQQSYHAPIVGGSQWPSRVVHTVGVTEFATTERVRSSGRTRSTSPLGKYLLGSQVANLKLQLLRKPMPTILAQIAFAFELRNSGRIRGVAVGVDHSRRGMVRSAQRFGEKALSRGCVLLGREKEIQGGTGGIHRSIQVTPLTFHPDVTTIVRSRSYVRT